MYNRMKGLLQFIFLLLTVFSAPAITRIPEPVISDARGNVLAEETNGVPYWTMARPTGNGAVPGYRPVAFGNGVDLAHSSAWRGHEVDVTGFYYLYNRYYDPVAGQWVSFDPMPNDRDPNGQSICGGDTINYVDPDGLLAKRATSGSMDSGVPISASSAFMLGYYAGGILSAAQQGYNGGRQIVANTFTFGGSDALGLTASRQFQGPDYTASRVLATVGRETLITAATLGSAQLARGGSMAALYSYRGLQIANAGRSGYAIGTGVNQVANGNKWGYLSIAGGSLGFAGSLSYAVANPTLNSFSSRAADDGWVSQLEQQQQVGPTTTTIRNSSLAGQNHPVTGIPFNGRGFPNFSSVAIKTVQIDYTGMRLGDEAAANEAAGLDSTPEGFTWHHVEDGTTMQLVPRDIHAATGHTGGFSLYPQP